MGTTEDFRYPAVEGQRPWWEPAVGWWTGQVHRAVTVDETVYAAFSRVHQMVDGPELLLSPSMLFRVLAAARRSSSNRTAGEDVP